MMRPAKVAHIFPILSFGGLWRHMQAAEQLPSCTIQSVALEIFALERPHLRVPISSRIYGVGASPSDYRKVKLLSARLKERLEEIQPDVIHTYHCFSDFYAIGVAAELGIPVVRTVAGVSQMGWGGSFEARTAREDWNSEEIEIELRLESAVSVTLAVSEDMKRRLVGYGFAPEKIRVSYLGTDTHPPPRMPPYVRARSYDRSLVIGFMHRLEPVKLLPVLLPVLRNLIHRGLTVRMVLVEGGRLTNSFASELDKAGVHYDLLPLSSALWELVPPLDCLLLSSRSEGVPLVPLEAMARGIPVVSTAVGGVPEIIDHGITGWLYEQHDAGGLESALLTVAADPQTCARISSAALEAVRARMNISSHVWDLHQTYMSLAGPDRSRSAATSSEEFQE